MSTRGTATLSRLLITFCDIGGSSRGIREYLLRHGQSLKDSLPESTQIITEIRRNEHPEIRANYLHGMHLEKYSQEERQRELRQSGAIMWRKPLPTARTQERQRMFRAGKTGLPADEERRAIIARVIAADTVKGREKLKTEFNIDRFSIPDLLRYPVAGREPRDWPVHKVWGPSGKLVNVGNLSVKDIEDQMWWVTRTCGNRTTKWGANVKRSVSRLPSIQGPWTAVTASVLKEETFTMSVV